MKNRIFNKIGIATLLILCLILSTACEKKPVIEDKPVVEEKEQQVIAPTPVSEKTEVSEPVTTEAPENTPDVAENTTETAAASGSDVLKKVIGASDDEGIYTIVVTLSDKVADKGVVEMVYYGAKGTPQEDSVVNTFRIEYYKEEAGTYEVHTFFNGEVDQNLHHQTEVKVNNTFGASLRAGNVTIYYTPDGGETQEVYKADADAFYPS